MRRKWRAEARHRIDRPGRAAFARMPARLAGIAHRFGAGIDVQWQDDDRRNFENCHGEAASEDAVQADSEPFSVRLLTPTTTTVIRWSPVSVATPTRHSKPDSGEL